MKPLSLIVLLLGASFAQAPLPQRPVPPQTPDAENDVRLPNGKMQRDEIAKRRGFHRQIKGRLLLRPATCVIQHGEGCHAVSESKGSD